MLQALEGKVSKQAQSQATSESGGDESSEPQNFTLGGLISFARLSFIEEGGAGANLLVIHVRRLISK